MSNSNIDLNAFLQSAFGWIDAESGYGAQYPESRGMLNFFRGRLGSNIPSGQCVLRIPGKPPVWQEPWDEPARALADDLEELARQIRALLPED